MELSVQPLPKSNPMGYDVAHQLLVRLLRGEIRGGQRLIEVEIAASFQVSRTPVRDAMRQLQSLNVVEFAPHRGVVLRRFGADELLEVYDIRRLLETEAVRRACGRISPDRLKSMLDEQSRLLSDSQRGEQWSQSAIESDVTLHDLICDSCGSPRLASEVRRYRVFVSAIREAIGADLNAQARAMQEHLLILKGLLDGSVLKSVDAMNHHIDQASMTALNCLRPVLDADD